MRVNLVISSIAARRGGPSVSVPSLACGLVRGGAEVRLWTTEVDADDAAVPGAGVELVVCGRSWPGALAASREMRRRMAEAEGDVWHANGLWELPSHYAARHCRKAGLPLVISPRGMLEPWALGRSRWKKAVTGRLYQWADLRGAACLHALNDGEVASIRACGLAGPVAVVPNGVEPGEFEGLEGAAEAFGARFTEARGRKVALFLSRLHPKKGLLHLLAGWAQVRREGWVLVVAGPDDAGHGAEVAARARELGVDGSVVLTGALYGELKLGALGAADVLVLPSFSEGFSVVVLEGMAAGLPVLITPGCNFPEVESAGAGLVREATAEGMAAGLEALMGLSEAERAAMGARGRGLVRERYSWERVSGEMLGVYGWLLGGGEPPSCVRTY
jgi:poly(glycerol-phosphate) alpha-glucosyltransferase